MAVAGLFLALGLVVVAVRLRLNLGHGLVAGCLVLWLLSASESSLFLKALGQGVFETKALTLIVVVGLLIVLARLLELTGHLDGLLSRFEGLVRSPRLSLVAFPALIGLLPMPGGAVFSAPMVERLANGLDLSPVRKSLINYWFRHVWEYCWPLYPSLIMIVYLSGVSMGRLVAVTGLVTLAALFFGHLFILKGLPRKGRLSSTPDQAPGSALLGLSPILIVLAGALGGRSLLGFLQGAIPWIGGIPALAPMGLALVVALLVVVAASGRPVLLLKATFSATTLGIVYLVIAVITFQSAAVASGAIGQLGQIMTALHLPLLVLVGCLPFLIGLITGYGLAYVATGFPVFLGLLPSDGIIPYLLLGHICGFAGVLVSPAHACLGLSNRYFGAASGGVYAKLWRPWLLTLAAGWAIGLVLIYFS